jgi:hypothetical protein
MAITKQTAKCSTGGKAPRVDLARKAARFPRVSRQISDHQGANWDQHSWIMFTGQGSVPWTIQPADGSNDPERFSDGSRVIPRHVVAWCRLNPNVMLDRSTCYRWGLLEESDDDNMVASDGENEDDDGDESEDDYEGTHESDDSEDSNGNGGRAGKSPTIGEDWIVKTVRYDDGVNLYSGRGDRGRWIPISFHNLKICEAQTENMKQLLKIDKWCMENPGRPKYLPVGSRPQIAVAEHHLTNIPIIYQSDRKGCVALSAANVISRCDPGAARLLSQCPADFNNLRRFAAWLNHHTAWETRDVFKMEQDHSGDYPSPKDVMEHVLASTNGVYVVQLVDSVGYSSHAIGLNLFNRTIHDCAEKFAMTVSPKSLAICCGQGNDCVGFLAAYKLHNPQSRGRKGTKRKYRLK